MNALTKMIQGWARRKWKRAMEETNQPEFHSTTWSNLKLEETIAENIGQLGDVNSGKKSVKAS